MTTPDRVSSRAPLRSAVTACSRLLSAPAFVFLVLSLCLFSATAVSGNPQRDKKADYALIYGTVWGPDSRPLYGVAVEIRRADQKHAHWELHSDHSGEFAQRVPPGPADYVVWADLKGFKYASGAPLRLDQPVKVHIDNDEREDIGLHLTQ